MISVEAAQRIIGRAAASPRVERVPLKSALDRVLSGDVISRVFLPPFDKSAMDGYALRAGDRSERFRVIEMIPAGAVPRKTVGPGECAKIMTGGMVPRGADSVVRVELTREEGGFIRVLEREGSPHICRRGEDVRPGGKVLASGALLRPQEIGILASLGRAEVDVAARPAVAVIATGSEIAAPGRSLLPGRIFDSNSYSLAAQAARCGAAVTIRRKVADRVPLIRRAVEEALERCALVLVSGGVSAGDLDFVPEILRGLGVDLRFERIAVQPGKPTVFGTRRGRHVFGVPGNPVSTFVIFEVFIKPLLLRLAGREEEPLTVSGRLSQAIARKNTERASFVPVRLAGDAVELLEYHGSAHIQALSLANALLYIPRGVSGYAQGSRVHVRLL